MIVECFGIPGAGKSTVTSLLVKEFGFKEIPKQVPKIYGTQFLLRHPFFVCMWCFLLFRESLFVCSFSLGRFKLAVFFNTIGRIQYASKHYSKEDLVVLDEGLMQRIFTLFESPKVPEIFHAILKKIPVEHLILQIEYVGVDFTESRVGTYRRTKGEEYVRNWRKIMAENFKSLSESLKQSKFYRIIYVRNDGPDTALETIVQDLKRYQTGII